MTDSAPPIELDGAVAVVTGGAGGIGRGIVGSLLRRGASVAILDVEATAIDAAVEALGKLGPVSGHRVDITDEDAVAAVADAVYADHGHVDLLFNNAGVTSGGGGKPWQQEPNDWRWCFGVNVFGMAIGVSTFVPRMIDGGKPGYVINTGSKQGITTPPGNAAYNTSKAAVKVVTEQLAHELRSQDSRLSAHLLIPGWTFTGLTAADPQAEKPDGAWHAVQVVDFMLAALGRGDFYILCPDNEVDRATDLKRIRWAAGDIVENRPALSRWHPDFAGAFEAFVKGGT